MYNKKEWVSNEIITKEALNNIENGIEEVENQMFEKFLELESTMSLDKAIVPEMFTGTDKEKLQQAFDKAIDDCVPIKISGKYTLNEGETIFLNKSQYPRTPIFVFGGGMIHKPNAGFIFDSEEISSGDYYFKNIFFQGSTAGDTIVFNCSNGRLIRITSESCFYTKLGSIFYSNEYIQTIKMCNDTIVYCHHCIDAAGAYDVRINSVLAEWNHGSFINQFTVEGGLEYGYDYLNNVTIVNSCFEGYEMTGSDNFPVFNVKRCTSLVLNGNYFENNAGGNIVLDGNINNVEISNNILLGTQQPDCFINWAGTLKGCSSHNNRSTVSHIHNTENIISGYVLSENDVSTVYLNEKIDNVYYIDKDYKVGIEHNNNYINIVKNTMNSTETNEWKSWVGTVTHEIDGNVPYIKYKTDSSNTNSYMYQLITELFDRNKKGCVIIIEARVYDQNSFTVAISGFVSGNMFGKNYFDATANKNNWYTYACYLPLDMLEESDDRVQIQIYPLAPSYAGDYTIDVKNISVYMVDKQVNPNAALDQLGYSNYGTSIQPGLQKYDKNNDGVVDIPYGQTDSRPILNTNHVGFVYFDTTINKPIWWTGEKWVSSDGSDI